MSIMLATLLSLTITNGGSVGPMNATTRTCDITATQVRMALICPACMVTPPVFKKVRFNSEVPNVHVLQSLTVEASDYMGLSRPGPVGGTLTEYAAYLPNTHSKLGLRLSTGKHLVYQNTSRAGQKLIRFMDLNCK